MARFWKNVTVLPLTFNTQGYAGGGRDSPEKKGPQSSSILDKALTNFGTEDGEGTMCLHTFIHSCIHLFDKYRGLAALLGAGSKTDQKFLSPWSSFLDRYMNTKAKYTVQREVIWGKRDREIGQ